MQGLHDKIAVVTGAGRGLGRAAALRLAADGAHVVVADVDLVQATKVAEEVKALGRKALVSCHDVGDHLAARAMIAETLGAWGDVHVLINNAGILRDAMLAKVAEDDFDAVLRVNLKGVFNCTQAATDAMRAKGHGGVIVNVASIAYLGNVGQTSYSAAKAGVTGLTRTWALELARYGIRVNAVAPGLMDTDMVRGMPAKIRDDLVASVPMRRLGLPAEFAATVAFLASDESAFMTGQVLHLCGGASVGGF